MRYPCRAFRLHSARHLVEARFRRTKKACLVSDISEEARLRARTEISRTGTQSVENTPCASTFRASVLKISRFLLKPKMRLRANPVVGGSGCGAVGDRALPELPADIKDQLPTVGNALRRRPRPTFKLYQKSLSCCRRIHDGIMVRTKHAFVKSPCPLNDIPRSAA